MSNIVPLTQSPSTGARSLYLSLVDLSLDEIMFQVAPIKKLVASFNLLKLSLPALLEIRLCIYTVKPDCFGYGNGLESNAVVLNDFKLVLFRCQLEQVKRKINSLMVFRCQLEQASLEDTVAIKLYCTGTLVLCFNMSFQLLIICLIITHILDKFVQVNP